MRWIVVVVFSLAPVAGAWATTPFALFGTAERRFEARQELPRWEAVAARIVREAPVYAACRDDPEACPNRAVMAWQALLGALEGAPPREQIVKINRFINQWEYRSDIRNYGRSDYWASPLEFLTRSGDCEDYAITKYVSLRLLGFSVERLRVVIVHDELREQAHAVLAVHVDGDVLILDNLTNAVLPHHRVAQYTPYYSVNESARWVHVGTSRLTMAGLEGDTPPAPAER